MDASRRKMNEYPPLTDDELTQIADEGFLMYDAEEAAACPIAPPPSSPPPLPAASAPPSESGRHPDCNC